MAGISGTGKTQLTRLVAGATGGVFVSEPVRPNWTDSSELIGYTRLDGKFVPGALLRVARAALNSPDKQFFFLLDEMNIARVEYYLAEVLSILEERIRVDGQLRSAPLAPHSPPDAEDNSWSEVPLPPNLCIVGSVNMDETTHGFSRKVLDRSFVIEFSEIDLSNVGAVDETPVAHEWSSADWGQQFLGLAEFPDSEHPALSRVISTLSQVNEHLKKAQLQVGYRVRDETALFCINAEDCMDSFVTGEGQHVDPLDLAISMKVLPRIQGGGQMIGDVLDGLLSWATGIQEASPEEEDSSGSPEPTGEEYPFPICVARIEMMLGRYRVTGFTSYWL